MQATPRREKHASIGVLVPHLFFLDRWKGDVQFLGILANFQIEESGYTVVNSLACEVAIGRYLVRTLQLVGFEGGGGVPISGGNELSAFTTKTPHIEHNVRDTNLKPQWGASFHKL